MTLTPPAPFRPSFPLVLFPTLYKNLTHLDTLSLAALTEACQEANYIFTPLLYKTLILNERANPFQVLVEPSTSRFAIDRAIHQLTNVETLIIRQVPSLESVQQLKELVNKANKQGIYLLPRLSKIRVDANDGLIAAFFKILAKAVPHNPRPITYKNTNDYEPARLHNAMYHLKPHCVISPEDDLQVNGEVSVLTFNRFGSGEVVFPHDRQWQITRLFLALHEQGQLGRMKVVHPEAGVRGFSRDIWMESRFKCWIHERFGPGEGWKAGIVQEMLAKVHFDDA